MRLSLRHEIAPSTGTWSGAATSMVASEHEPRVIEVGDWSEAPSDVWVAPRAPSNDAPTPNVDPLGETTVEEEHFGRQSSERAIVLELARSCLSDLAALGRMRAPSPGLAWTDGDESERRLLARIDAIVACGPEILEDLRGDLAERPVADPDLTWALVLVHGCIGSQRAIHRAFDIAESSDLEDDEVRAALVDALSLAPHPRIDHALRDWLASGDGARRAIAVATSSLRRSLSVEDALAAVQDDDVRVIRAASGALGRLDVRIDPAAVAWLLSHEDEEVVRGAFESAILLGSAEGLSCAERLCREGRGAFADAACIAAIAGDEQTLEALLEDAAAGGSPTSLVALGWYGSARAIDYLVGRMQTEDREVRLAARRAIGRIAGDLPGDAPDERAEVGRTLPPPPCGKRPTTATWRRWWESARERARRDVQYRFGRSWTVDLVKRELSSPESRVEDRRLAYLELAARTGHRPVLDLHHFVARQRTQLASFARETLGPASRSSWPSQLAG
ncbi:MAG: hypothetical protein IT379_18695 [Deltaproteobacteria bacterium]|nr:hypothetical protein [Deltaproteobacteria bacterium]